MFTRIASATTVAALLAGLAAVGPANARSSGSTDGDSYINDAVKNPRFIEPYADRSPSRYRAYYPRAGYVDRVRAAERGYYDPGSYRGRVTVRTYDPYAPYAAPYGYYGPGWRY